MQEISRIYQEWIQSDYDPVLGRPALEEVVAREFNISINEALQWLEEFYRYPK